MFRTTAIFQNSCSSKRHMFNRSPSLNNISVRMYCSHTPATFYRLQESLRSTPRNDLRFHFQGLAIAVPSSIFFKKPWRCQLCCYFGQRVKRRKNEINWIIRLETAAETRHQTHFVFILPHRVQPSLCLWRAPCLPSQRPFPWPRYWHWTVMHRLSEQIGFSDHWLRDRLGPGQSGVSCLITTHGVR